MREEKIPKALSRSFRDADSETFSVIEEILSQSAKWDCAISSCARRVSPSRIADKIWSFSVDDIQSLSLVLFKNIPATKLFPIGPC